MRDVILPYLQQTPGASTSMVARRLAVNESTADYHLRRLRKEGKVLCAVAGRERVWFARPCGLCPMVRALLPPLRRGGFAAFVAALDETPTTARGLAQRAGATVGEARWAIEVLSAAGIARKTPTGRVALADDAAYCAAKALGASPCDRWGRCAVSLAWEKREREQAARRPPA